MTRPTSSMFAVALLAGCIGSRSLTTGQRCPCAPGWSCDTATNTCVSSSSDASAEGQDATAVSSCACDTTALIMSPLGQQSIMVSRDCFCASQFGFLCGDFDQVATLCARADVHMVSAANFAGCTLQFLHVTVGSAAKGRPTYATLEFHGNSFFAASYEADLVCNNLPADETNDSHLYVATDGYFDLDPSCGSSVEWNPCPSDGGTGADGAACSIPPVSPCGDVGQRCCNNLDGNDRCFVHGACVRQESLPAGCDANPAVRVCVDCGGKNQPCCDQAPLCGSGLACGRDADAGTATCQDGCGMEGAACCGGGGCQAGLHCSTYDETGTCIRCGEAGEACCAFPNPSTCWSGLGCNDAGVCE